MSGGRLVVLDRQGRDVKKYPLSEGLVTLGSHHGCDIRVLLPSISAHHATVVVHANQTVIQNVGDGDTLVNGQKVSVLALRHNDIITLGDRSMRWEYTNPSGKQGRQGDTALLSVGRGRGRWRGRRAGRDTLRRTSEPDLRTRTLPLALQMSQRASMPAGSTGGKQVAVVQPQRRETNVQTTTKIVPSPRPNTSNKRPRTAKNELDTSITDSDSDRSKRKSAKLSERKASPSLQNTTKATMWIESRKTSPRRSVKGNTSSTNSLQVRASPRKSARIQTPEQVRIANVRRMASSAKKSTPLRMAVLRKAQSAQKMTVMKIQAPLKIDHTKQAALLLMTGHSSKVKSATPKKSSPSYVVKRPSPVRKTPGTGKKASGRRSKESGTPSGLGVTPKRASTFANPSRKSNRNSGNKSVTVLEITDSEANTSTGQNSLQRSRRKSPRKSPVLPRPKKSSLKDPKRKTKKSESIKFDLSNLENQETTDVLMVTDTTKRSYDSESVSDSDMMLRYSDVTISPSPRRPINSRSSRILEKTLGTSSILSPTPSVRSESTNSRKSLRGNLILQKALDTSVGDHSYSAYSRRTSRSMTDTNRSEGSIQSAFRTHTLSPRTTRNGMESYSIVDLVSVDTNDSLRSGSVYNSIGSSNGTNFGTPQTSVGRKTRSIIDNNFLGSSTPYVGKITRTTSRGPSESSYASNRLRSLPDMSQRSNKSETSNRSSVSTRRSKSLTTPENTLKYISLNTTRISRRSRSRSRINDSELILLDEEDDSSPKTSRRVTKASQNLTNTVNESSISTQHEGTVTPENRHSPQDMGTPILSIRTLLNSSQSSSRSQKSPKNVRPTYKRKTIGVLSQKIKRQQDIKSRSLNISARQTILRLSKDSSNDSFHTDEGTMQHDNEVVVTPKSAVKLVPEAVKNKHSSAKKTQSKRSIIDDLNQSVIVKQLFNSPVKRKLSQSMTEFSRKQLYENDGNTIPERSRVMSGMLTRSPDNSIVDNTVSYTPERFVSPMNTPSNSPNLSGIARLFRNNSPKNDLSDVRGVKFLFRSPRARTSIKNDLTNVSRVKAVFSRSPTNRLSDVRIKNMFAKSPVNDLRKVPGVKSLFRPQNSPKNDLTDVRGVKSMFSRNSPTNDLTNVSGIKRLQRRSPNNDLRDVRGVRKMFKNSKQKSDNDVSGVEELFNTSNQTHRDTNNVFDQLLGKPPIRAVYSKTLKSKNNPKTKVQTKSLHISFDQIYNNVGDWLEKELQKHFDKGKSTPKPNESTSLKRELNRIATSTVDGTTPIRNSRVRDSTLIRTIIGEKERQLSASERYSARRLPIKKRSLIERNLEKSKSADDSSRLPIKKRAVVHSTPVKGRIHLTMNASELGRVSPIAAVDRTRDVERETPTRSPKKHRSEAFDQTTQPVEALALEPVRESLKPSPKKTRSRAVKANVKRQSTFRQNYDTTKIRSRRETKPVNSEIREQRVSLVIKKKAPALTPKSVENSIPDSHTTRQRQVAKIASPKNTRSKLKKATIALPKTPPVLRPTKVAQNDLANKDVKPTRVTKRDSKKSLKETLKRKSLNNKSIIAQNIGKSNTNQVKRRGKVVVEESNIDNTNGTISKTKTRGKIEKQTSNKSEPTRQTRKTKVNIPSPKQSDVNQTAVQRNRRGQVVPALVQEDPPRGRRRQPLLTEAENPRTGTRQALKNTVKTEVNEEETLPKGRRRQLTTSQIKPEPNTRKRLVKGVIEPTDKAVGVDNENEGMKRSKRLQKTASVETVSDNTKDAGKTVTDNTKGKTVTEKVYSPKVTRGRGKRTAAEKSKSKLKNSAVESASAESDKNESTDVAVGKTSRSTRSKKAIEVNKVTQGIGKRVTKVAEAVAEKPPETRSGKRKRNLEQSFEDKTDEPTMKRTRNQIQSALRSPVKTRAKAVKGKAEQVKRTTATRTRKR